MSEQTKLGDRNQGDAPGNSTASAAGLRPTDKPEGQQAQDDVPLSAGAVLNGGAYQGGDSPADADDDVDEERRPLDSREHFGGDGAQFVAEDPATDAHVTPSAHGAMPGDDGYDEAAHPGVIDQDLD